MSSDDRFDYIAIGPHGVYALCEDTPDGVVTDFIVAVTERGHRVERVPVAEAVDRHLAYLRQDPKMAALIDGSRND